MLAMPLKCTYGDLDKLRDLPDRPGPLSKLMAATKLTTVDKFRIARLTRTVNEQLAEYVKALVELGKKYGTENKTDRATSWSIKPEHGEAYRAEKGKLDEVECELAVSRLPLTAIEEETLTALDLSLLEPFVDAPADL